MAHCRPPRESADKPAVQVDLLNLREEPSTVETPQGGGVIQKLSSFSLFRAPAQTPLVPRETDSANYGSHKTPDTLSPKIPPQDRPCVECEEQSRPGRTFSQQHLVSIRRNMAWAIELLQDRTAPCSAVRSQVEEIIRENYSLLFSEKDEPLPATSRQ